MFKGAGVLQVSCASITGGGGGGGGGGWWWGGGGGGWGGGGKRATVNPSTVSHFSNPE